jgi:tetratricopeptide (TPR) repeat protein
LTVGWLDWLLPPGADETGRRLLASEDAAAVLDRLPARRAAGGLEAAVRRLLMDGRAGERPELVRLLAERAPERFVPHAAELWEAGYAEAAELACKQALAKQPGFVDAREVLIRLLLARDAKEEALRLLEAGPRSEPALQLLRAEVLLEVERTEEALELLGRLAGQMDAAIKSAGITDWQYYRGMHQRVHGLRDAVLRRELGSEAVLQDAVRRGAPAPNSGANHSLVGLAAMAESPRIAADLALQPADVEAAKRASSARPHDRMSSVRLGEAYLRTGDFNRARAVFRDMVQTDPAFFPGQLGLGAALTAKERGVLRALRQLPSAPVASGWGDVVDLSVLSAIELQVVAACANPLAAALPGLREAGARVVLLPLDVRPTDLDDFAHLEDERLDSRAAAGIGGLASSHGVAVARIEGLLDTVEHLVFAHELAHLAFWHLPEPRQQAFFALYEAARDAEWAWTDYQRSNVDEFFACSYEDVLKVRWGRPAVPPDSQGWFTRVQAFFDTLA